MLAQCGLPAETASITGDPLRQSINANNVKVGARERQQSHPISRPCCRHHQRQCHGTTAAAVPRYPPAAVHCMQACCCCWENSLVVLYNMLCTSPSHPGCMSCCSRLLRKHDSFPSDDCGCGQSLLPALSNASSGSLEGLHTCMHRTHSNRLHTRCTGLVYSRECMLGSGAGRVNRTPNASRQGSCVEASRWGCGCSTLVTQQGRDGATGTGAMPDQCIGE